MLFKQIGFVNSIAPTKIFRSFTEPVIKAIETCGHRSWFSHDQSLRGSITPSSRRAKTSTSKQTAERVGAATSKLLKKNTTLTLEADGVGAKAEAEATRARVAAAVNFIVDNFDREEYDRNRGFAAMIDCKQALCVCVCVAQQGLQKRNDEPTRLPPLPNRGHQKNHTRMQARGKIYFRVGSEKSS
jgi:hypothetical protein